MSSNKSKTLWEKLAQLLGTSLDSNTTEDSEFIIAGETDAQAAFSTLDRLFQSHQKVALGRIHFLNLEDLVVRKITNREETLKRLRDIAEGVIRDFAGPHDEFQLDGHANATLYFPTLTREAGQLKLAALADAIADRIRADQPKLADLQHSTKTAGIDRQSFLQQLSSRDRRLSDARAIQAEKRRLEAGNRAVTAMGATRETGPDQPPEELPYWRRVLENQEHEIPENAAVSFSAVWRVKVEMVTGRLCRVSLGEMEADADDRFRGDVTDVRRAQLDSYLLATTVSHVAGMIEQGRQVIHVVPVSFRSIERDPHRLKVMGVLRSAPEEVRRLIVCEIVELPPDASVQRLQEPFTRIQSLCRSAMAQLKLSTSSLRGWRKVGISTVGVELPAELALTRDLVHRLDAFSFKARSTSLTPYIWGVDTKLAAAATLAADFSYLSGNLLDRLLGDVDTARPLTLKELYLAS
jgi:hypothetical protein